MSIDPHKLPPQQTPITIFDLVNIRVALNDVESANIFEACKILDDHILHFAKGLTKG